MESAISLFGGACPRGQRPDDDAGRGGRQCYWALLGVGTQVRHTGKFLGDYRARTALLRPRLLRCDALSNPSHVQAERFLSFGGLRPLRQRKSPWHRSGSRAALPPLLRRKSSVHSRGRPSDPLNHYAGWV